MNLNLDINRREFIRSAFRWPILGLLAWLGFRLGRRSWRAETSGSCRRQRLCHGCAVLDDCGLPQARDFKLRTS